MWGKRAIDLLTLTDVEKIYNKTEQGDTRENLCREIGKIPEVTFELTLGC